MSGTPRLALAGCRPHAATIAHRPRPAGAPTAHRAAPHLAGVQRLQSAAGNAAVCSMLTAQRDPTKTPMSLPEAIGFIGMNPEAWKEAKSLEGTKGIAAKRVLTGLQNGEAEKSLSTTLGMAQWLVGAGIDPLRRMGTFIRALSVLQATEPRARDTMSQLIQMFDGAETGKYNLSRLVMSGHSNGIELWGEQTGAGEGGGTLLLDRELRGLTNAFPVAAAQVKGVMFSACYSVKAILLCADVFPNLEGAWAYAKFSPSIAQGSGKHIQAFERETRKKGKLDKGDARGSSALWTRDKGFIVNDPAKVNPRNLLSQLSFLLTKISGIYDGSVDYDKGFLDGAYGRFQEYSVHPRADAAKKAIVDEWIPIMLRLRYWAVVRERFAKHYAGDIKAAYDELAWPQPNWTSMTRAEVKHERDEFETHADAATPRAKAFGEGPLKRGLYGLRESHIPTSWI